MRARINHGRRGKSIDRLLIEYDLRVPRDYHDAIIESYANGNHEQVITLFNLMKEYDQKTFLLNCAHMCRIYGEKVHDFIIKNL